MSQEIETAESVELPEIDSRGGSYFIPTNLLVETERSVLHELEVKIQERYDELGGRYSLTSEYVFPEGSDLEVDAFEGLKVSWAPIS